MIVVILFSAVSLLAESQKLSADGNKNLRSASMHLSGGRYEKALPLFKAVLLENPHHIISLENIASIYYDVTKDYFEADSYYSKAIIEINAIFAEHQELLKTDEKAAKKFYKKHIKKEKLEDKLEQISKFKASCWINIFRQAQEKFKNEDYDGCIEEFLALNEMAPDSSKTIKMLAYAYNKKGDTEKTLEFMIKTSELEPDDDMVRTQIANTYFGLEDFEKAIEWYTKASEINPSNPDNFYNAGLSFKNIKKDTLAFNAFLESYKINPENIKTLVILSNLALKMDDHKESTKYLQEAVDLDRVDGNIDNPDYVTTLCYKLFGIKKFDELLKYAELWFEIDPSSIEAVQMLYNTAKELNNKELMSKYEKIYKQME